MNVSRLRQLDIQTKIGLVLVGIILPTFLIVTIVENKLTRPVLEADMQNVGITSAESIVGKIITNHLMTVEHGSALIENEIHELLYVQPSIIRMDVYSKDGTTGNLKLIASNVEEDPIPPPPPLVDQITSESRADENGLPYWEIRVPIRHGTLHLARGTHKTQGMVRVLVSAKAVNRVLQTFWKITVIAAAISVVVLILTLNYFLRKTVADERLLRKAENENLQLSQRLHEAQRQMMNVEKLAVMGQLTANFAHEIGTPLNAVGGHLQLLKEELLPKAEKGGERWKERLEIISGELTRIEEIVKGFLQTTSKPASQRQLVDLNNLVDKTIGIVRPILDGIGLDVICELDRKMGPIRAVPSDIEQILLNLTNNSLDSLQTKLSRNEKARLQLKFSTKLSRQNGEEWAEVTVYDTGIGIKKEDLRNIFKPFFTTKRPGHGTGLGLNICHELASKYGGVLEIDSKDGAWAEVKLRLPYRVNL